MVHVLANIVKIVVFSPSSDTLLGVDSPLPLGHVAVGVHCADEDGLKLVHAGISEQQGWVIQGNGGGGMDIGVLILKKEICRSTLRHKPQTICVKLDLQSIGSSPDLQR